MRETFGSTCHGAGSADQPDGRGEGRPWPRHRRRSSPPRGVVARATGREALAEEMPEAYKDVREVVDVVHRFGISTRVARLDRSAVIKG